MIVLFEMWLTPFVVRYTIQLLLSISDKIVETEATDEPHDSPY